MGSKEWVEQKTKRLDLKETDDQKIVHVSSAEDLTSIMKDEIGTDFDVKGYNVLLKVIAYGPFDYLLGAVNLGLVLKIGDEAYDDKAFPGGPRCKEGDVVFWCELGAPVTYINDQECVFVTDTSIVGNIQRKYLKNELLEKCSARTKHARDLRDNLTEIGR